MSTPIKLLGIDLPRVPAALPFNGQQRFSSPENWYAEPFTKRTTCRTPGQCGGNCDCGCPYNTMTEVERLPLIEEIAKIFPNEWLAFILSPEEDEEFEPTHGKLVAHSSHPDDIYDAVNTVLWNQHIYVFFNGDFAAMQASYGQTWDQALRPVDERLFSGPKQVSDAVQSLSGATALPENLLDLVYSVVDTLYGEPNLSESIRRLRLARVRAAQINDERLLPVIDSALDQLETGLPRLNEVKWFLEEALAELEEMVLVELT